MDGHRVSRRHQRWWAVLMGSLVVVAAGCSSSSPTALTEPPIVTEPPVVTSTTVDPEAGAEADLAAVTALWESVLVALGTGADERPARVGALAPAVAVTVSDRLNAELPPEPGQLTSNASYEVVDPDRITIADCAGSTQSSVLGLATVGLRATATRTGAGGTWVVGELETVTNCVPRLQAEAAFAAYEAFLIEYDRLWRTLDPADPALYTFSETAGAALRDSFTKFQERGWTSRFDIVKQTGEVIGMALDGAIVIDECTNYGPEAGMVTAEGTLAPGYELRPFEHAQARMVPSGSDWIFDGYTNVGDSCLFAPTDQQAPLL